MVRGFMFRSSIANHKISNRLLLALSADDFELLTPHLEFVSLPRRKQLEYPNRDIDAVYFIEEGIASVVVPGKPEAMGEVGLIGQEGATGLPLILGDRRSPHSVFIQSEGSGFHIEA